MPKAFIKRYMPNHEEIRRNRHLRIFGTLLHDPNLWHLNRRSVAGAFAVGLFMAFVPTPGQMILAAGAAILFRVNLPISVALVWLTNPVTMPPIFYFAYLVGTWVLGHPAGHFHFEPTWDWLIHSLNGIWAPFLLGCLICGGVSALVGYIGIRGLWRWHAVRRWQARARPKIIARRRDRGNVAAGNPGRNGSGSRPPPGTPAPTRPDAPAGQAGRDPASSK